MAKLDPQTPGEPGADQAPDEQVTVPATVLADLQAQVARLSQQVLTAGKPKISNVESEASLPNQDDIDVTKLKSPVLTKQGWLVPEKFGSNPNAPRL